MTWRISLVAPAVASIVLFMLGLAALLSSQSLEEVRIQYDGKANAGATVQHACKVGSLGTTTSCTLSMIVEKDMEPPILVSYLIDPFYQNYLQYVLATLSSELEGGSVDKAARWRCKDTNSDLTADGQDILPCGLQATSLFNDTFEVFGIPIDQAGIAWKSDIDRYENPPDYLVRPATSWLHERYPTIVKKTEGVKNERFVAWMRPEALPRVTKPYGKLYTKLKAGQNLTIRINASFPVKTLEARKELVLTTYNALGGKSTEFVIFLWVFSALSGVLAVVFFVIQLTRPRALGDPRFSRVAF